MYSFMILGIGIVLMQKDLKPPATARPRQPEALTVFGVFLATILVEKNVLPSSKLKQNK